MDGSCDGWMRAAAPLPRKAKGFAESRLPWRQCAAALLPRGLGAPMGSDWGRTGLGASGATSGLAGAPAAAVCDHGPALGASPAPCSPTKRVWHAASAPHLLDGTIPEHCLWSGACRGPRRDQRRSGQHGQGSRPGEVWAWQGARVGAEGAREQRQAAVRACRACKRSWEARVHNGPRINCALMPKVPFKPSSRGRARRRWSHSASPPAHPCLPACLPLMSHMCEHPSAWPGQAGIPQRRPLGLRSLVLVAGALRYALRRLVLNISPTGAVCKDQSCLQG